MMARLNVAAVLLALLSCLILVSAQDCSGIVNGYTYDLTPLAMALNFGLVNATDAYWGRTFSYGPCTGNYQCYSRDYGYAPAVCEVYPNATSVDAGNRGFAVMSQLPTMSPDQGFQMTFYNGAQNRSSVINFFCNPYEVPGTLVYDSESPLRTYNFNWRTKYACPLNGPYPTPTYTPSPTYNPWYPSPTPAVPAHNQCCLYLYNNNSSIDKTLCSSSCPSYIPNFTFGSSWPVASCGDCFFHKK